MSVEDENKCKQRFKGVENFLRRVAFNLGNTPSQTEVKIISCIPIDVTDLQQKIIQLEKQLDDAKSVKDTAKNNGKDGKEASKNVSKDASKNAGKDIIRSSVNNNIKASKVSEVSNTPKRASAVHTALYSSHFPQFAGAVSKAVECSQSSQAIQCEEGFSNKRNKSTVSFLLSTAPTNKAIGGSLYSDKSNISSIERSHTVLNELRRKFLRKKKKAAKKHKVETHLVYYAQTGNARYNSRSVTRDYNPTDPTMNGREMMDRSFLSNMIRKQYQTATAIDELSESSQISSPICRDLDTWRKNTRLYESDICSCCHETFHNVDNYITSSPLNEFTGLTINMNKNRNAYYDSSLYDLVPVKEKSFRNRKDIEIPKRKENKIDMKCWPENVRAKARCSSVIVNYQTVAPARTEHRKKLYTKATKKDLIGEVRINKDKRVTKLDRHTGMESSKSCCVDLGELYPKPLQKVKTVIMTETMEPSRRNVECFTDIVSAVDCQTVTPKLDDKTEMTLNQIKIMLQSVLTEVKTNSQLKNTDNKTKKDAIIQKGASQCNLLDGSRFLNSFTYSPYNMNPYGPSCSKQMPSNCFCHPSLPHSMRYMQNYPVFIHTPGRQNMCTSCYRSSQYKSCPKNTTARTNTEQEKRGKETEKLIKEIYKSVALGIPGKDTSRSECDDLKSVRTASNKSKQMDDKHTKHLISEIFRNADVQVNTSDTHNLNTSIFYRNKDVSTRSQSETTDPGVDRHNENKNVQGKTQSSTETETDVEKIKYSRRVVPVKRIETISESTNSDTSSSETESDVTTIAVKKPEKKKSGLFSKVCSLFNRNKRKDTKIDTESESDSSDSDYQTIYSQKISPPKRTEHRTQRSRAHSKLHSRRSRQAQRSPERPKRSPYMEQEYRRLWNEKLMFQNTRPRYSSERPATRETPPRPIQRPIYYQNYEARSVLVDPRHYQPRYDIINRKPCLVEVNNQSKPYAQNYQHLDGFGEGRGVIPPSINAVRRNTAVKDAMVVRKSVNAKVMAKGLSWLKSHKPRCGEQWKKFITES